MAAVFDSQGTGGTAVYRSQEYEAPAGVVLSLAPIVLGYQVSPLALRPGVRLSLAALALSYRVPPVALSTVSPPVFTPSPWRTLSIAAEPRVLAVKAEQRNYSVTR